MAERTFREELEALVVAQGELIGRMARESDYGDVPAEGLAVAAMLAETLSDALAHAARRALAKQEGGAS